MHKAPFAIGYVLDVLRCVGSAFYRVDEVLLLKLEVKSGFRQNTTSLRRRCSYLYHTAGIEKYY